MTYVLHPMCISKHKLKNCRGGQPHPPLEGVIIFISSISRVLQDNFYGTKSWKSIKYSQSYDTVCQLALLGVKGLSNISKDANLWKSEFWRSLILDHIPLPTPLKTHYPTPPPLAIHEKKTQYF